MISVEELSKRLGNFHLGPLNLEVSEGEILVVLGKNGSGKTTMLNLIVGILQPDQGRIFLNQSLLNKIPIEKRRIGYVFQKLYLFPQLNVFANIMFGLRHQKEFEQSKRRMGEIVSLLSIESLLTRNIQSLSGGEQQKVSLARTLVTEPRLLLMDEPFANLDITSKLNLTKEINTIVHKLKIPTIYVTHYANEAFGIADKIMILNNGNVIEDGTREEVQLRPKAQFTRSLVETL
jgi:molybdate/tungstate transport system ATP-binding protein